jgi:hypothetical protein
LQICTSGKTPSGGTPGFRNIVEDVVSMTPGRLIWHNCLSNWELDRLG